MTRRALLCSLLLAACGPALSHPDPDGGEGDVDAGTTPPAQPAALKLTPSVQDYGNVVVGSSAAAILQVVNPGGEGVGSLAVALAGPDAAAFSIQPGGCTGQALSAGAVCALSLRFTPDSAGTKRATLTVSAPGGSPSTQAQLMGNGMAPGTLTLGPSAPDFGPVAVGATAKTTLTLKNAGGAPTGPVTLAIDGSSKAELAKGADACSGKALAAGASCTIDIQLTPKVAGAKVASVTASASPGGGTVVSVQAEAQASVALDVGGAGSGGVTSSPEGLSCSGECTSTQHSFATSAVTLLAVPATGSVFAGWTGCASTPTPTSCIVDLDAATVKVAASFEPAPAQPDAPPSGPLRPWGGAKAHLRFLSTATGWAYTQACIYGADDDARPYAILVDEEAVVNGTNEKTATYADVPGGVGLRVSYSETFGPEADPHACDFSAADDIHQGDALPPTGFYTLFKIPVSKTASCDSGLSATCEYYPVASGGSDFCSFGGTFAVRDDGYAGSYRVFNLTEDAAMLSLAQSQTPLANVDLAGVASPGLAAADGPTVRICPSYLSCFAGPSDGLTACRGGDDAWTVGRVDAPRITTAKKTSIYVFGKTSAPNAAGTGLASPLSVTFLVAHDLAE